MPEMLNEHSPCIKDLNNCNETVFLNPHRCLNKKITGTNPFYHGFVPNLKIVCEGLENGEPP